MGRYDSGEDYVCIRMPGRGITYRISDVAPVPGQDYRNFAIDHMIVDRVLEEALRLSTNYRIILIPSGLGAYLLSDLAKALKLADNAVSEVARCVIDAQITMISAWYRERSGQRAVVVRSPTELATLSGENQVAIVRASASFGSTDSLWAAASYFSRARHSFMFKSLWRTERRSDDILDTPTGAVSVAWLEKNTASWAATGAPPLVDRETIVYLRMGGSSAWIVQPEVPEDMQRILNRSPPHGRVARIA